MSDAAPTNEAPEVPTEEISPEALKEYIPEEEAQDGAK